MRYVPWIFLLFVSKLLSAQAVGIADLEPDTASVHRVALKDGSILLGTIVAGDHISVTIKTGPLGVITIPRGSVQKIERIEDGAPREQWSWFRVADPSNYLALASARPLERRAVLYRNKYALISSVEAGLTRHLSVGGGFELFSLLGRERRIPAFFGQVKVGARVADGVHLAANTMVLNNATVVYGWNGDGNRRITSGIVHGIATFGNRDAHLSVGGGVLIGPERERPGGILTLAATYRLSPMVALVSENWILTENEYAFWSYGIRLLGQGLSVDLAMINTTEFVEDSVIGLPYIGFSILF